MADTTKCKGTNCVHKEVCFRFTVPASVRQSWFSKVPIRKDGSCDRFIDKDE